MTGPGLQLCVLGRPTLHSDNVPFRLATKKALGIAAYLVLEGPTLRTTLAELLWEQSPEHARDNLRGELYRLKQSPLAGVLLETAGQLSLSIASDVALFEHYLSQEAWGEALALRRGLLLEGLAFSDAPLFDEWLTFSREHWEERFRDVMQRQAAALAEGGALKEALALYRHLVQLEPLREEAQRALMRLHDRLGERPQALQQYRHFADFLAQELQLAPAKETRALAQRLRSGGTAPTLERLSPRELAGRTREWQQLEDAWAKGQIIVLLGEPGIGKTRLMQDFLADKGKVILGRFRPYDRAVPFSGWARLLRTLLDLHPDVVLPPWMRLELSRLLPELSEARPSPKLDKLRLYAAVVEAVRLCSPEFDVSAGDDIQYMDVATFEIGAYVSQQFAPGATRDKAVRSIMCCRQGEIPAEFRATFEAMEEAGQLAFISLRPLDLEGVTELLDDLEPKLAALAEALYRYTGGNPLFVLETLKSLAERDKLAWSAEQLETEWPSLIPSEKVQGLIRHRLERLSPVAQQVARLVAVAREQFGPELALRVLQLTPLALAEASDELENAGILRSGRFVHDVLAEAVLASIPGTSRKLLHAQVLTVLESRRVPAALLALHAAAAEQSEAVWQHSLAAAQEAKGLARWAEGLDFLERAEQVLGQLPDHPVAEAQLRLEREELLRLAEREQQA